MKRLIIDAHGHCDEYKLFNWIDPPETVIDLMDKAGIDITLITTYGDAPAYKQATSNLVRYVDAYPDRFIGFVRIDPRGADEALEVIENASTLPQIKGIKIHPISSLLKPYNPFSLKMIRKAAELGMPIFFHCGDKVSAQPWQIGIAAQLCPEATIICHMGGFFHNEESLRVAASCKNIYLDTSSIPYPHIIAKAVEMIGADRVVFATDCPAGDPISELNKILNLKFSKQIEEKILYKNIARILDIKEIRGNRI